MSRPILYDFWASWCGPCRAMAPTVDTFEKDHPGVEVRRINIDEETEVAQQFSVRSIPTFVLVKEGQELTRLVGARPASSFTAAMESYLPVVDSTPAAG